MATWAIRRVFRALATVLAAASLVFVLTAIAPGDAVTSASRPGASSRFPSAGERAALRARWGLDRPAPVRLASWLGGATHLDLGVSLQDGRPVSRRIGEALPLTLAVNLAALALALAAALPVAIAGARRPGGLVDRVGAAVFDVLFAVPAFVTGLLLLLVFAVRLRIAPLFADLSLGLPAFVLPVVTLSLGALAPLGRFLRSVLIEALASPAALAARARGEGDGALVLRALRRSAGSLAALFALLVPSAASGSVLVESLFSLPGCGALLAEAVQTRDEPLVLGLALLAATTVVVSSTAAAIVSNRLDPRLGELTLEAR